MKVFVAGATAGLHAGAHGVAQTWMTRRAEWAVAIFS